MVGHTALDGRTAARKHRMIEIGQGIETEEQEEDREPGQTDCSYELDQPYRHQEALSPHEHPRYKRLSKVLGEVRRE